MNLFSSRHRTEIGHSVGKAGIDSANHSFFRRQSFPHGCTDVQGTVYLNTNFPPSMPL